jgi:beta-N-acetylhexosaminidase
MVDVKAVPFNLNDEQAAWVRNTLAAMGEKEKIGQLFCTLGIMTGKKSIEHLTKDIGIGGIMFRPKKATSLQNIYRKLQNSAKIPLLCAANLESGGSGACEDGTNFAMPMGAAAAGGTEMGYRLGKIACSEGAAVGCNWAFAPIVDIDMNFRNPIANLRTFGSSPERVLEMGRQYLKAAREEKVAVSIKHFPGDGADELDQHLLTSVNSLPVNEWSASYGMIYKALIAEGAETVMVGHIAQPAWVEKLNPASTMRERYMPASLSKELLFGLLRGELGFNGLIVSDASVMIGFTTAMPREKAVPWCIANGCDMLLFNKNVDEDYRYMVQGVNDGVITPERLDEAVTRILAAKAALDLPQKQQEGALVPRQEALKKTINCPLHTEWARECADKAITLVKDTQGLLPISPSKTRRVYLNVIENTPARKSPFALDIKARLAREGFAVTLRNRTLNLDFTKAAKGLITPGAIKLIKEITAGVAAFKEKYDLVLVIANLQTQSNASVVRLNWKVIMGMGNDAPWFTAEVPTLFISTANPYHLLDAPMMKTFINAYTGTPYTLDALIDKLMGRSGFKGISPVDPFCGRQDTHL